MIGTVFKNIFFSKNKNKKTCLIIKKNYDIFLIVLFLLSKNYFKELLFSHIKDCFKK